MTPLRYVRTNDTMSTSGLARLFGFKPEGTAIGVCDGEWRKQRGNTWRFWRLADL